MLPIKAIILAAGRGERMRPLTDRTPKPMLPVRGKPLMQWPVEALAREGFTDLVINTAWLGDQISDYFDPIGISNNNYPLSNAEQKTLKLHFSHEGRDFGEALETAGGIVRALPHLGERFWVLAGDVFAPDFVFSPAAVERFVQSRQLAHLWLVPNPAHNPKGDFGLTSGGMLTNASEPRHTYSTIGLYHRDLFSAPYCNISSGNPLGIKAALAPLLRAAIAENRVSGELYSGAWTDVGTPERLAQLG